MEASSKIDKPTPLYAVKALNDFLRIESDNSAQPWLIGTGIGKDDVLIIYTASAKETKNSLPVDLIEWQGYPFVIKETERPTTDLPT